MHTHNMRYSDILSHIKSYQVIARDIERHLPILRINIDMISCRYYIDENEPDSQMISCRETCLSTWYHIKRHLPLLRINIHLRYRHDIMSWYWFARWEDVSWCLLLCLDKTWYLIICLDISCLRVISWCTSPRGRYISPSCESTCKHISWDILTY